MHTIITDWQPAPKVLPANTVVFAVGDVHGCIEQLKAMRATLCDLLRDGQCRATVVHIGDYIDRGPDSIGVLQMLRGGLAAGEVEEVFLAGNHDQYLLEMIGDSEFESDFLARWLAEGGGSTLDQLGIQAAQRDRMTLADLRSRIREAIDGDLVKFLQSLGYTHRIGDYLFVHAGIVPGTAPEDNDLADLLLIRDEFLGASATWTHDFCVVHGHTPSWPRVCGHRIPIDTGVFFTEALTAVQLESDRLRFITIADRPEVDWQQYADRCVLRR